MLYKAYESLPPIELTRELPDTGLPALEAIAATGAEALASHVVPDRTLLGLLGLPTNSSLERTLDHGRRPRAPLPHSRGTGAQYHLELSFVCTDLSDLAAGVYRDSRDSRLPSSLPLPSGDRDRRHPASASWWCSGVYTRKFGVAN